MPRIDDRAKCELARESKRCLRKMLNDGRRIAVTGHAAAAFDRARFLSPS
jgi:hypothetical protein